MISSTTSMTRGRELRRDASSRCDGALSATVDDRRSFLRRSIFASTAFAVSSYAMPPIIPPSYALESSSSESTLSSTSSSSESTASKSNVAVSRGTDDDGDCSFKSGAYGIEEYTNTIVASRDTNVSPREVYDTISSEYLRGAASSVMSTSMEEEGDGRTIRRRRSPRALDVGAGAGVSTQVLYDMGYHRIDAIDWSSTAWDRYVTNDPNGRCPNGVKFYEMDDERYLEMWRREMAYRRRPRRDENDADADADADGISFDAVVFNFAVNRSKAIRFATELLDKEHGRLLAPINSYDDYWLSQIYTVMDGYGNVLWSAADVGAWSVLFQPDVTQDTVSVGEEGEKKPVSNEECNSFVIVFFISIGCTLLELIIGPRKYIFLPVSSFVVYLSLPSPSLVFHLYLSLVLGDMVLAVQRISEEIAFVSRFLSIVFMVMEGCDTMHGRTLRLHFLDI